jgi:hypothetical protein
MHSVLNCHNVAKHTSFTWDSYGSMCFKKSFTMVLQMLLHGECYENVYT